MGRVAAPLFGHKKLIGFQGHSEKTYDLCFFTTKGNQKKPNILVLGLRCSHPSLFHTKQHPFFSATRPSSNSTGLYIICICSREDACKQTCYPTCSIHPLVPSSAPPLSFSASFCSLFINSGFCACWSQRAVELPSALNKLKENDSYKWHMGEYKQKMCLQK